MTDTPALGIEVAVLRVFTDAAGNFGNPLGVVDAAAVPAPRRQALATELGYSETVFVDLPAAGATTARAWIFTPATELSFAGHPTVGAAWWLRERGTPVETLQVPAGALQVRYSDDRTAVVARAEWGPEFVFHALASVDQVLAADPAAYADDGYHYLWAWLDRDRGHIRSRMFANEPGVPEDEATGSAAVRLTGELRRDLTITQGHGSQILTTWHPEGWVAVQGRVVSDGVRRLGAKPPSVAAQSDSIVPVMPVVPRSRELSAIEIKRVRPRVDELLSHYESAIGADFPGYRNHVYRTITYAMHFLDGAAEDERLVETAMVYHDIGLWTDHELAYLEPSEAVALADNEKFGWGLDPEALRGAIHWHHKVLPYRGPHERIIEACRKADWIDASKGLVRKGVSRTAIKAVEAAFPNRGFHATLLRLAKDYGGSTPVGGWKVTRGIVKW